MELKCFAVYDEKVGTYMSPMFFNTVGQALRVWIDTVKDPKTMFYRHPGDYTLFELGTYDDEKGRFVNLPTPRSHGVAIEFLRDGEAAGSSVVDALENFPTRKKADGIVDELSKQ